MAAAMLSAVLFPVPIAAAQVAVLLSKNLGPYAEAVQGLKDSLKGNSFLDFDLGGKEDAGKSTLKKITAKTPDVIVSVGGTALKVAASHEKRTPVVFAMVLRPEKLYDTAQGNVAGVTPDVDYGILFERLSKILPNAKIVGTLYNPDSSKAEMEKAKKQAARYGIELQAQAASSDKDVPSGFRAVADKVQAWWIYPESSILTMDALKFLALETTKRSIPVVAPAEKFFKLGACLAIQATYRGVGQQASEVVKRILENGDTPKSIGVEKARHVEVVLNRKVADTLKISVPPEAQKLVDRYVE